MAYQNVGTPRFYIDLLQYLKSLNTVTVANHTAFNDLFNLDPTVPVSITDTAIKLTLGLSNTYKYEIEKLINPTNAYYALLNHNMESSQAGGMFLSNPGDIYFTFENREDILNAPDDGKSVVLSRAISLVITTVDPPDAPVTDIVTVPVDPLPPETV